MPPCPVRCPQSFFSRISESLWAVISAMVPVPVPMSRICLSFPVTVMAAPRITPSVLTFIADLSFRTENLLNRNSPGTCFVSAFLPIGCSFFRFRKEKPVLHEKRAVTHGRKIRVVGHDYYCLPVSVPQRKEKLVKLILCTAVKIA